MAIVECGRRFEDEDFAETTWQLGRYYWMPKLGLKGILRLTVFRDVFIASGCGVGGGSLGYANTLYRARPAFFGDRQWGAIADWEGELRPHYDTAERMLGVADYPLEGASDLLLREYAHEIGAADSYKQTRVGAFFGEPGKTVSDPYFGGEGPDRAGCIGCGSCMVGCRHNAKNTLRKNYLWFAEKLGVEIFPERQVTDIRPLGEGADGSEGFEVTSERPGAWFRKRRATVRARGVVVAAGALGTNQLLANCRHRGSLPRLSDRLGGLVRTNSESINAVTAPDDSQDFAKSVAISSSIYPDPDTHIEVVTYGPRADSMSFLFTFLTGAGSRGKRALLWLAQALRHPVTAARMLWPRKWSQRTVILLVMQTLDNAIRLRPKRRLLGRGIRLQTEQDPEKPNPTYIPAAEAVARWFERRTGGIAQGGLTESILNIPTTAHILGGAVIGADREHGVVDGDNRAFGYDNLLVCDGAAIPANPGVNPSLTITALAERAMSRVPPKEGAERGELPDAARGAAEPPVPVA